MINISKVVTFTIISTIIVFLIFFIFILLLSYYTNENVITMFYLWFDSPQSLVYIVSPIICMTIASLSKNTKSKKGPLRK